MNQPEDGSVYILEDKIVNIEGRLIERKFAAFLINGDETTILAHGDTFSEVVTEAKKFGYTVYAKKWVEV